MKVIYPETYRVRRAEGAVIVTFTTPAGRTYDIAINPIGIDDFMAHLSRASMGGEAPVLATRGAPVETRLPLEGAEALRQLYAGGPATLLAAGIDRTRQQVWIRWSAGEDRETELLLPVDQAETLASALLECIVLLRGASSGRLQ